MSKRRRRAGVGMARVTAPGDPRLHRNARAATDAERTLGAGLTYDRHGKLRVKAGPAVPRLPEDATADDVIAWARDLDRSLRTAGLIPR